MLKKEFEELAGISVSEEQYLPINDLYMSCELNKREFVDSIKGFIKAIDRQNRMEIRHNQDTVFVTTGDKDPYTREYWGHFYKLVSKEMDIKTGRIKYILRELDEDETEEVNKKYGVDCTTNHYWTYDINKKFDSAIIKIVK